MVIQFGAWFKLVRCPSYVYARVGRQEILRTTRLLRARTATGYVGHAQRTTFRVVQGAADWNTLVESTKKHA